MSPYATDPEPMPDLTTEDIFGPLPNDTEADELIAADASNDLPEASSITDEDICQECGGLCGFCVGCGERDCSPFILCACDRGRDDE